MAKRSTLGHRNVVVRKGSSHAAHIDHRHRVLSNTCRQLRRSPQRASAALAKRSTLGHRNVFVRKGSSRVAHIDIYFVWGSSSPASTVYVSRLALPLGGPPRAPLRGGGERTAVRSWAGRLHGGDSQLSRRRPAGLSVAALLAAGAMGGRRLGTVTLSAGAGGRRRRSPRSSGLSATSHAVRPSPSQSWYHMLALLPQPAGSV
jgi:hypothetical protein